MTNPPAQIGGQPLQTYPVLSGVDDIIELCHEAEIAVSNEHIERFGDFAPDSE